MKSAYMKLLEYLSIQLVCVPEANRASRLSPWTSCGPASLWRTVPLAHGPAEPSPWLRSWPCLAPSFCLDCNKAVTYGIDICVYIGYHSICIAVGWGNSAHFAVQNLEKVVADSGEITRQAVQQLAVVCWGWRPLKRRRTLARRRACCLAELFLFLGEGSRNR